MIAFSLSRTLPKALPAKTIPRIARACSLVQKKMSTRPHEVGLVFVTESMMKTMNRRYRNKSKATDVLSFSSDEGDRIARSSSGEAHDLGDIVICPSYAAKEAKRRSIPLSEELARLVVHGTLHLMGYDHADEASEHRMFFIQEDIVFRVMKNV
jgi:probable rRNA maturation factor